MSCGCHTSADIHNKSKQSCCFRPPLNVSEDKDKFTMRFELPGLNKEDIHIELEGDILHIFGNKHKEGSPEDYAESPHGKFDRKLRLTDGVDKESISSAFKDGILTIIIQKSEKAKARNIEVN